MHEMVRVTIQRDGGHLITRAINPSVVAMNLARSNSPGNDFNNFIAAVKTDIISVSTKRTRQDARSKFHSLFGGQDD